MSKPAFAQPAPMRSNGVALALIEEVNALRQGKNLQPYQVSPILMRVAQDHADHVAQTGYLSRYERGLSPYQRALEAGYPVAGNLLEGGLYAENLHSGLNATVAEVIEKWSGDTQYFRALYAEDLKDAGAGVASSGGVTYFVLDVGAALEDPAYWYTATPTSDGVVLTSTPLDDGTIYHVVQAKEYLWNIALAYGMTVEEIKKLNGLATNDIYEGEKLLIFKPKPQIGPTPTPTLGVTPTATFGIPTSTVTEPVTPTATLTPTPPPLPPASSQSGQKAIGVIVVLALLAAGVGALLGRKKE